MEIEFTDHARRRIQRRRIRPEWVHEVVEHPECVVIDQVDQGVEHRLAFIREAGNRVLRVVLVADAVPVRIITAFFDDTLKELP